jgi:hypothetical protein
MSTSMAPKKLMFSLCRGDVSEHLVVDTAPGAA